MRVRSVAAALTLAVAAQSLGAQDGKRTTTGEESLLIGDIPQVYGASRFDQAATEAPASVTVITAEEIATYGWRTLADLLRSVRGFYVTNDRTYSFAGTRGFGRLGDYNTRLLILVDGVRFNENVYEGGYVGTESIVDMANVDRVEIIRGPASSLYGNNALLGIVSVSTIRGRTRDGLQVSGAAESFGTHDVALSGGHRLANGLDFLISGKTYRSAGRDYFFPDFNAPAFNNGIAAGIDHDRRENALAKAEWGPFTLAAMVNLRRKQIPSAPYDVDFGNGAMAYTDNLRNLSLRYQQTFRGGSELSASLAGNRYDYVGDYPYGDEMHIERAHGRWGTAEAQYNWRLTPANRVLVGASLDYNARQQQEYGGGRPFVVDFANNTTANTWALYAVDEARVGSHLIVNAGVRRDAATWLGANWSPRAALIYTLGSGSALKALYGSAFRAPNNYERFFSDAATQEANPALRPEHVYTYELLLEQRLSHAFKGSASIYRYDVRGLIDRGVDPTDSLLQFRNLGRVAGEGVETEIGFEFARLAGRASYALQRSWDPATQRDLSNSPKHLAMLNASTPLPRDVARVAVEVRAMSSRLARDGSHIPGYAVANVNIGTRHLVRGLSASLGVYNVFDARYLDPMPEENKQRTILQDPRAVRLSASWSY